MFPALVLGGALALGQPPAQPALDFSPAPSIAPRVAAQPDERPAPANITIEVPPPAPPAPPAPPPPAAAPGDRWALMRTLQGTWYGVQLDDARTSVSGWTEMSYTASTNSVSNQPVVWNDRANRFLMNQTWIRLERSVVTSGTSDVTWGYRVDADYGSDYRFSLMRGLLNNQLLNSQGNQNLYGIDLIGFYANLYIPTLFQGTDVRVGRLFTPFGAESLEGISTPFVSRSYAFNWSPPFTHMGIMVSPTFNANWSGKFMLANGNDVWIGDNAQEMRFVGALTWVNDRKTDSVTYGWSWGRGKFNTGKPFNPATTGEQSEPAGRNNINVNDLVWAHVFDPKWTYATELIYGYQTGVPANVPGGLIDLRKDSSGTAHWGSWVNYLYYNFAPNLTGIVRYELFDDFEGQRTGFEGLYSALTVGCQYRPWKSVLIRPEIRYDYNGYSRPFEGKHGILTAALDCIVRW
jgi:hypothetical protein